MPTDGPIPGQLLGIRKHTCGWGGGPEVPQVTASANQPNLHLKPRPPQCHTGDDDVTDFVCPQGGVSGYNMYVCKERAAVTIKHMVNHVRPPPPPLRDHSHVGGLSEQITCRLIFLPTWVTAALL